MTYGASDRATEPVAAGDTESPEDFVESPRASAVAVRTANSKLVVPDECACCGAPPSRRVREAHVSGRVALVPYCAECHAHVSREGTRAFATSLSSAIVVFTLAAGLPLLWQPRAALFYAVCVLFGGLVPIATGAIWPRRRRPGHLVAGRAAWFRFDGALVCARPDWGEQVARASGAPAFAIRFRERRVPAGALAAVVFVCALLPGYYRAHFPSVRVVNLTDDRLALAVDGRFRASVPPTSAESAGAGVELRVPAGRRVLTATDETGRVVDTATVTVRSGGQHLYAPASGSYCFWIETTGYGRSKGAGTEITHLRGPVRFWALEDSIDIWFSPLPDADFDDRSTGGYLHAIRQSRCDTAPGAVRGAPGNRGTPPFATGVE